MKTIKNEDKYFIKKCDRDLGNVDIPRKFHSLPFKNKISFGVFDFEQKNHIKIKNFSDQCVPKGDVLYKPSFNHFDLLKWIDTSIVNLNFYNKIELKIGIV